MAEGRTLGAHVTDFGHRGQYRRPVAHGPDDPYHPYLTVDLNDQPGTQPPQWVLEGSPGQSPPTCASRIATGFDAASPPAAWPRCGAPRIWCWGERSRSRSWPSALPTTTMAMRRFKREARAAARVSTHAHVVTIYDVGDLEVDARDIDSTARPFIVMEYLAGGTVADAIRVGRGAPPGGGALDPRGGVGARSRPRSRDRPPRHQACQLPAQPQSRAARRRLRDRPAGERGHDHQHRRAVRHRRLPVARAGARPRGDRRLGPLCPRRRRLRAARRRTAL